MIFWMFFDPIFLSWRVSDELDLGGWWTKSSRVEKGVKNMFFQLISEKVISWSSHLVIFGIYVLFYPMYKISTDPYQLSCHRKTEKWPKSIREGSKQKMMMIYGFYMWFNHILVVLWTIVYFRPRVQPQVEPLFWWPELLEPHLRHFRHHLETYNFGPPGPIMIKFGESMYFGCRIHIYHQKYD
jgi:hypothetical protein